MRFVSVYMVHPYSSIDSGTDRKKFRKDIKKESEYLCYQYGLMMMMMMMMM